MSFARRKRAGEHAARTTVMRPVEQARDCDPTVEFRPVADDASGGRQTQQFEAVTPASETPGKTAAKDSAENRSRPATNDAKASASGGSSKRVTSIARSIAWRQWVRRLCGFIVFDLLLIGVFAGVFVATCAIQLPSGTSDTWSIVDVPLERFSRVAQIVPFGDLWHKGVSVAMLDGGTYVYPFSDMLVYAYPVFGVVVVVEVLSLIHGAFDVRKIRRQLKPLNELALTAEAISNAAASDLAFGARPAVGDGDDALDMEQLVSLEHAITSVSIDAPQISTGDKDLRSIEVALNSLLRRMQQAKLQQMRFVSDASHELRTPIAVIQGYVNMLDRWGKTDPEVLEESIEALKTESAHMQELVEQLLFLARGDSGRNTLQMTTLNLAEIAAEVVEESAMIDPDHVYVIEPADLDVHDGKYQIVGDVAMIKQSMRIIVQNAAKYSEASTAITIAVRADWGEVVYSVQDEGCGMSEKDTAHIFERFYRADNARDGRAGGTGLGLAIAKWIVDAHEGTIGVVSREGVGTRFTVRFNAA